MTLIEKATLWAAMLNGSYDNDDNDNGVLLDRLIDALEAAQAMAGAFDEYGRGGSFVAARQALTRFKDAMK